MEYLIWARSARLVIALVASATIVVAACAGSATPSPSPTPSPTASPAPLDACLVGTWKVVGQTQNSPADDENITFTGGEGEVFTIDAQGGVTIDTHAAKPVAFRDSAGETFSATVAGTGRGTLSTTSAGPTRYFAFTPSSDDTRTTVSFDSAGAALGPPRPDTAFSAAYTCAPGRFTFYKTPPINYMIDGPIVELTAASGNASSTASRAPS